MRRHLLTIAVILTGATGCDNVDWGGIDWQLMPPPTVSTDSLFGGSVQTGDDSTALTVGPLLLAGERGGARATLVVVGEIVNGGIRAIDEDLPRVARLTVTGSRWILFSEGVRVGTLVADAAGSTAGYCPERPTVAGVVELVPTASDASRLLALPAAVGNERGYEAFRSLSDVYDQRVATLSWAGDAIPRIGASWPADGLVAARRDIQVFQPVEASDPTVTATFLFRDQLEVAPAGEGAYALFLLGTRRGEEYREDFAWYRPVDTEGKGAPRYFSHLDWDGDGETDVLLDVIGSERRWFAALGRRDGQWVRTFQDRCGGGSPAGG